MSAGLLSTRAEIGIRIAPNRDIVSANDEVFRPEHQDESRILIYEAELIGDALSDIGSHLRAGRLELASITEPERQTTMRYAPDGESRILLTRAHRAAQDILKEGA